MTRDEIEDAISELQMLEADPEGTQEFHDRFMHLWRLLRDAGVDVSNLLSETR
jgi:hypothetical protein